MNTDGGVKCFGQIPLVLAMVLRSYGQAYPSPESAKSGYIDRYYQRLSGQSQRKPVGICIEPICGTNVKQSHQMKEGVDALQWYFVSMIYLHNKPEGG